MDTTAAPLIEWAQEREAIRKRRATGEPPPWTKDPILATYRFTNLRRRDDRVSQWLIKNVLNENGFTFWSFLQFSALCRWVNWPPTLIALRRVGLWPRKKLDLPAIGDAIDALCATGTKTWTGAYMIRGPKPRDGGIGKGRFVANIVAGMEGGSRLLTDAIETGSCEKTWEALTTVPYFGRFMAGQVIADWTYCPVLQDALDLYAWAPPGPGSVRGFNRLMGRPLAARPSAGEWATQLVAWRTELIHALGPEYNDVTAMDVQNALCETDKFIRARMGEGRPRSTYRPETAY